MTSVLEKKSHSFNSYRLYYSHLLDNIGPLPQELTLSLPDEVFYGIWNEFYHYLSLVAESAHQGGGQKFVNYIKSHETLENLPNLSEITHYLISSDISEYPFTDKLEYWLNINALLEYGVFYNELPLKEQTLCRRFEYLQELDHFSEIMDLSLLTKYISKYSKQLDQKLWNNNCSILSKYLNSNKFTEINYKPIAGRSPYVNLGLERMLGEAIAKRKNCHYKLYQNLEVEIGEYSENYYPIRTSSKTEAQFKVFDLASVGSIRTNYPYLGLLLTSNSVQPLDQNEIKRLNNICVNLILQYGLEFGLALFDGYIFDSEYDKYLLSVVAAQIFKPNKHDPVQVKMLAAGRGAVFVYQNNKIQHIEINGPELNDNFIGKTGTTYCRNVVTVENNENNIQVILAPYAFGEALQAMPFSQLLKEGNENASNVLAWISQLPQKSMRPPKQARNLLSFRISPKSIEIASRPRWTLSDISQISGFLNLKNICKNYLNQYKHLNINILYAHLHSDRVVDVHQEISTKIAKALKNDLNEERISFSMQPLIDNLHVRDIFDYEAYSNMLREQDLVPDVILTEDSLLIDRIGQGIIYYISKNSLSSDCKIVYEGNRSMNLLYDDDTVVQLVDHMDKDGRLACISFDLAQIYYRQAPNLYEKLFKNEILNNYPNTILGKLFIKHSDKNYHQIMYEEVYKNKNIPYRNELFQRISKEIRPNINNVEATKPMLSYVDALSNEINNREITRSKKVISMYILEGSYDAQFDRYSKVHKTFAIPGIDTYRVSFVSEELNINSISIKS